MVEDKPPADQAAYILGSIESSTQTLDKYGRRYETLGDDIMAILRQVAAGEKVAAHRLRTALQAGEKIRHRLSWAVLAIPYTELVERLRGESERTQRRPSGS